MKEKIIQYLENSNNYVSGQKISEDLHVSRTAVWKNINILREEGYEIESSTRRGYRLVRKPDVLSKGMLMRYLPEGVLPGEIHYYDSIDSTNEEAKRCAAKGAPDGSLYFSDNQTAGKGRRGRSWASPKGEDVFFTLLLRPDILPQNISMVTLVSALAVREAMSTYAGEQCQIKWPNDIILHGKKMCGILTEMSMEMTDIDYLVIGIGVNLNRHQFSDEIKEFASSVFLETGHRVERSHFLADVLVAFRERYEKFLQTQDLSLLMDEYNQYLINVGRKVKIIKRDEELVRTAIGIDQRGNLLVEDDDGHRESVFSGEVSVRGLYGYV